MKQYKTVTLFEHKYSTTINGGAEVFEIKEALIALVESETSRTYRVSRLSFKTTLNDVHVGYDSRYTPIRTKPIIINKNRPEESKYLTKNDKYSVLNQMRKDTFNEAYQSYLLTLKSLSGRVLYFDRNRGEGMIHIDSLGTSFQVYACNLKGKKTWYSNTACVYLERDQIVQIDSLAEVQYGLTPIISQGVLFDSEKWNSLDQSRLAFKCDEDGDAINGLFSTGEA